MPYWLLHVDKLTDDRLNVLEISDFLEEFGHLGCRRRVCVTRLPHGGPVCDLHGHTLHATSWLVSHCTLHQQPTWFLGQQMESL